MSRYAALLLIACAASPATAQQVYLRTPDTNYCNVRGASNTTPIRLTVDGECGLVNGSTVVVADVRGNTAANIHLENRGDRANLGRKVANLSGNSFDLLDLNGNPVAGTAHPTCSGVPTTHMGTCAYTGGGRVGLAAVHTVRPHPILYFDGPGGPRTAAMWDPANKANASNPPYARVLANGREYARSYGGRWGYELVAAQFRGGPTIDSALAWKLTGEPALREAALFGLRNPDQLLGSTACDETDKDCRLAVNSIIGFSMYGAVSYYNAYSLMRDQMTPAERAHFIEFFLADLPWSQAGVNYSGVSLIKPQLKATTGTVTATQGALTVTGNGTRFNTQVKPGDFIIMPGDSYAKPYLIASIESDTQLTVSAPVASATGPGAMANSTWQAAPRWNPSMYGFLWNQKHFIYNPLNGAGEAPPGSPYPIPSPYLGAYSGFYQVGDHNHSIERGVALYMAGLVTCQDDPRGCLLASLGYEWMHDRALPYALAVWTGFSASNAVYHQQNTTGRILQWAHWTKNSVENAPDPLAGTNIREQLALWMPFSTIPLGPHIPVAEAALIIPGATEMAASLTAMADDKTARHSRYLHWWLNNVRWYRPGGSINYAYGEQSIGYGSGGWAWEHYMLYEPTANPEPIAETTHHFTAANGEMCTAQFGRNCPPADDVRRFSISRSDWTEQSTYVAVNSTGWGCREHCSDDLGGYFYIFKNGRPLLATDTGDWFGSRAQRGYVQVGPVTNFYRGDLPVGTPTLWTSSSNDHMFVRTELKKAFIPEAGVTSLERQVFHLKKGGQDYVVDHVKGAFSKPQPVRGWQHYNLDGCGTAKDTGCASINRDSRRAVHAQPNARLNSRAFAVTSPVAIGTATGSENDGSYPEGAQNSFRWHVCPSADGERCDAASTAAEWVVVHQPSTDPAAGLAEIEVTVNGPFRQVEIFDPAAPKVLAFTAGGQTAPSLLLQTKHEGQAQYLITGLAPGAYRVLHEGETMGETMSVEERRHTLSFESAGGAIRVEPAPDGLAIGPAALPSAYKGQPYHAVLAAGQAARPNRWEMDGGVVCPGLSLRPGPETATIEGIPERAGMCRFTVRVKNATGSATRTFALPVLAAAPPPKPKSSGPAKAPAPAVPGDIRTFKAR